MFNQPNNPYMYGGYQSPPMRSEVIRVNGEPGARAYQMAPNSSALLLDETAPIVWLCTTDGAGYKSLTAYQIEPVKGEAEKQYGELEQRITRLEELINAKSDFIDVDEYKSTDNIGKRGANR